MADSDISRLSPKSAILQTSWELTSTLRAARSLRVEGIIFQRCSMRERKPMGEIETDIERDYKFIQKHSRERDTKREREKESCMNCLCVGRWAVARAEAAARGWSWACSRAGASPGPATGHTRRNPLYYHHKEEIIFLMITYITYFYLL